MKVLVIVKSLQMITCQVLLPDSHGWLIIFVVYASNEASVRKELWEDIRQLSSNQVVVGKPWIMMGDFNHVLNPMEHSVSSNLNVNRRIREFRSCLLDAELYDLVYKGSSFTWWNKNKERPVAKKLDRILVNDPWSAQFPLMLVLVLLTSQIMLLVL